MASKEPAKPDMQSPKYLVYSPVEQMLDDGLAFEGTDDKSKVMNQTDFIRLREHIQRIGQGMTVDLEDTLVRCLKTCIKIPDQ